MEPFWYRLKRVVRENDRLTSVVVVVVAIGTVGTQAEVGAGTEAAWSFPH